MKIWTVTYVNDDTADEFGTKVFTDQAAANAWADEYDRANDPDSDGTEGTGKFTKVEWHDIPIALKGQRWFVVDENGATFVLPTAEDAWQHAVDECAAGIEAVRVGSLIVPRDMSTDDLADYAASNGADEWPDE